MGKQKQRAKSPPAPRPRSKRKGKGRSKPEAASAPGGQYPLTVRMHAVRLVVEEGLAASRVERVLGPTEHSIQEWVRRYEAGGVDALVPYLAKPPGRWHKRGADPKRDAVVAHKGGEPSHGTRRIRDELRRFEGLGVSETGVRRILHEEGLIPDAAPAVEERRHPPRRFERATPNQLWQSDIFTFLLRRHERVYLVAFMNHVGGTPYPLVRQLRNVN